ncbi:MAG: TIGR02301 family protein [Rhizobiales bacterium]|nr:TIGR02301 family protein [Hyphomicrobiales bacterium]
MRKNRVLSPAAMLLGAAMWLQAPAAPAQVTDASYGDRLLRLAEILGAIHHLRDICGADEGLLWRKKMLEMLEVENPPGQFRARLIASFNNGFRGYRRTYSSCTASAKTAENRFLTEGSKLAAGLTDTLSATLADAQSQDQ